jgi:hypothetical protein
MQGNGVVVESLGTNHADEVVSAAIPHNALESFSPGLLEEALNSIGLNYLRDQDGDFCTIIPSDSISSHAVCWFLIDDEYPQIFTLYCRVSPRIPKRRWQDALLACNEYHTHYRFGRFQLSITEGQTDATLCFVAQLDLSDGTTAAFLKTFILSHISSACAFLGEPHVHKRFFLAPSRKRSSKATPKEVEYTK